MADTTWLESYIDSIAPDALNYSDTEDPAVYIYYNHMNKPVFLAKNGVIISTAHFFNYHISRDWVICRIRYDNRLTYRVYSYRYFEMGSLVYERQIIYDSPEFGTFFAAHATEELTDLDLVEIFLRINPYKRYKDNWPRYIYTYDLDERWKYITDPDFEIAGDLVRNTTRSDLEWYIPRAVQHNW